MSFHELSEQGWKHLKVVTEGGVYISILYRNNELAGFRSNDNIFWQLTEEDKLKYEVYRPMV